MMEIAGLVLDAVVACLLVATIIYCMVLDRRIRSFKAEQKSLSGLVGDLNNATQNAEEAVAGLKVTTKAAQGDLGGKLTKARSLSDELAFMVESGNSIATKLSDPSARGIQVKQPALFREPNDNVAVLDVHSARREKVEPAFSRIRPRHSSQTVAENPEDPVSAEHFPKSGNPYPNPEMQHNKEEEHGLDAIGTGNTLEQILRNAR